MSKRLRILVVDDDLGMIITLADILRKYGIEVETADNSIQALTILPHGFNCVICDMVMPGMNGVELREKMIDKAGNIPFIFVTAYVETAILEQVKSLPNTFLIEKPVAIPVLLQRLLRLFPEQTITQTFEI
jgi:two-component system, cell cycle sensor histidine kinase and response regulator CckA